MTYEEKIQKMIKIMHWFDANTTSHTDREVRNTYDFTSDDPTDKEIGRFYSNIYGNDRLTVDVNKLWED